MMKNLKRMLLLFVFAFVLVGVTQGINVEAASKVDAGKVLSGTWQTSAGVKVKFTKKYCKYYTSNGKYISKKKISSATKTSYGYLVKMKQGKKKSSYRFYKNNIVKLKYYNSWSGKKYSKKQCAIKKTIKSESQARALLKQYLKDHYEYIPQYIDCEYHTNGKWQFHGYDDMGDHTATSFWYEVRKNGKIYDSIMGGCIYK